MKIFSTAYKFTRMNRKIYLAIIKRKINVFCFVNYKGIKKNDNFPSIPENFASIPEKLATLKKTKKKSQTA